MQLLLDGGELDGVRVFETRTIQRAIAEQTFFELDLDDGRADPLQHGLHPRRRGSRAPTGCNTQRAFGHLGFTNVFVYADPARDIAVALMTSGKPALSPGLTRTLMIMQTIARKIPRDGRGPLRH